MAAGGSRLDLEDRFDLDRDAGRQLGEAEGAAGVVAVAVLAEDFVQQVAAAVDDKVLLVKSGVEFTQPSTFRTRRPSSVPWVFQTEWRILTAQSRGRLRPARPSGPRRACP